jgi:rare lipoprotein A
MIETAASLELPLDSWVRITNLSNGKTAVVKITDRGPYVHGRIIDVSLATAQKLGMVRAGVARVRVDPIEAPKK